MQSPPTIECSLRHGCVPAGNVSESLAAEAATLAQGLSRTVPQSLVESHPNPLPDFSAAGSRRSIAELAPGPPCSIPSFRSA